MRDTICVGQFDKYTGERIAVYTSISEAAAAVNGNPGNISAACKNKRRTAYGFIWAARELAKEAAWDAPKMRVMLDEGARMPERAHPTDAGYDLFSRETACIMHQASAVFDTGVHIELPPGYYGKIESRSGMNINHGVVSCGGVIGEGYTGSVCVKLYNLSNSGYVVQAGDKIAQLVIMRYAAPEFELVDALAETARGNNGFGSTGR